MDDRARPLGRAGGLAPFLAEHAREGEVHALERPQHARLERGRRVAQGLDELVRAQVAFPPLAQAAVDDLLEVVAAGQAPDLLGGHAHPRVALDQHAQQLADLVDVVARLPLGRGAVEDLAGGGERVARAGAAAPRVALLAHDPEVAELQRRAVAHEHVEGREVAVEQLAAVQLAQHLEDPRDLAARRPLRPALARAQQERAEVPVPRVLEREAVEDAPARPHEREGIEDADRARVAVEQLPEVGLAQPAVDVLAGLDADRRGDAAGVADAAGEIHLPEPALSEQPLDAVAEARLRAGDGLRGVEQAARGIEGRARGPRARRDGGDVGRQDGTLPVAPPDARLRDYYGSGLSGRPRHASQPTAIARARQTSTILSRLTLPT